MSRSKTTMKLYSFIWSFIVAQKLFFTLILFCSLVWALDITIWPYILKKIIDVLSLFENKREAAWSVLKLTVIKGVILWTIIELGFRCQGFLLAKSLPKLEAQIRMSMFDHIQRHSPKYFSQHFSGSLGNKIADMTSQVSSILEQLLTVFFPSLFGGILALYFFAEVNTLFAIILGIWIFVHFFICIFSSRKCDEYEQIHGETRSSLMGKIVDSFSNNFAVNIFYRFVYEKKIISKFQNLEEEKNYKAKKYSAYIRVFLGIFGFLIAGIGINGLMIYLWLHSKISTGEIAQIFNMTSNVMMMMWYASMAIPTLYQSIGLASQAYTLMQHPQDILDVQGAKPLIIKDGSITFENVSFYFDQTPMFVNKSIKIKGGEKVGLVGYSGAGKSTFVNLILRFYPITSGKILIDQQDISQITLESLRRQISLIPQEPALFHRTIKENISYGRPSATESEIIEAAKMAHCHEFIEKCEHGYNTLLGERGTKLSGGEKQRISIARAILTNAPILILDEATSALDSVTENYIQESLSHLMEKKTALVIAHRLSTLASMDRILVFKKGIIVEQGSHDELIELDGYYKRMWDMQAHGFLPDLDE